MKPPEFYRGREQTYIKHFFLEKYLERVAWNIFSFRDEFVYVDGFSGPWKSEDEAFGDTSFVIALKQLRRVREGVKKRKRRDIQVRCLFNDNNPDAIMVLEKAVAAYHDIETKVLCRNFEEVVPEIVDYVGRSFSLTFIDPTGWSGFGLRKIRPLLKLPGEVIINFMYDHVSRFLSDPRPEIAATFDQMFGGPNWYVEVEDRVGMGQSREDAVLDVYCERLRKFGDFKHVTSTRILKPLTDRSYFHLVYGTRHWKGLVEYRYVEKKAIDVQERRRVEAKLTHQIEKTRQGELFDKCEERIGPRSYEEERQRRLDTAYTMLRDNLVTRGICKYEELIGALLEVPMVWESDLKNWLRNMLDAGEIDIPDLKGRARTPKPGHAIVWKGDEN